MKYTKYIVEKHFIMLTDNMVFIIVEIIPVNIGKWVSTTCNTNKYSKVSQKPD